MVLRSFADHHTATGGKIIWDGLYDDVVASAEDTHFGAWDIPQQYASRGSPTTTLGTWRPCFTADIPIVFEGAICPVHIYKCFYLGGITAGLLKSLGSAR